jgi:hypothetical protein
VARGHSLSSVPSAVEDDRRRDGDVRPEVALVVLEAGRDVDRGAIRARVEHDELVGGDVVGRPDGVGTAVGIPRVEEARPVARELCAEIDFAVAPVRERDVEDVDELCGGSGRGEGGGGGALRVRDDRRSFHTISSLSTPPNNAPEPWKQPSGREPKAPPTSS